MDSIKSTELFQVLLKCETLNAPHRNVAEVEDELIELIREARQEVSAGADPEEILEDYFGLEPDYIFDLIDL